MTNNSVCGIGVVYNACIGGAHILDSEVTDVVEASSLSLNPNHIHICATAVAPRMTTRPWIGLSASPRRPSPGERG